MFKIFFMFFLMIHILGDYYFQNDTLAMEFYFKPIYGGEMR